MINQIQALSDYVFASKYAKHLKDKNRRETWEEAVSRSKQMYYDLYADEEIRKEIDLAFDAYYERLAIGSNRCLQFGGDAVIKRNVRCYNCSYSYCDRPRFFQEAMWILLAGCGVGFSVQKHHIDKLPHISSPSIEETKTFVVPDSIEGWGDAIGVLLSSYFASDQPFPEYSKKTVHFDFSQIRPKGSEFSHGIGKAPGPEPLRFALEKIRTLLEKCVSNGIDKLRTIDAYDIVMHSSDAVLSGGVRRSSTICLFSIDDDLMINAKTGNWLQENPQRARSNNSAVCIRGKVSKEQFHKLFVAARYSGDPGILWTSDTEFGTNPSYGSDSLMLTKDGLKRIKDLKVGDTIWSKEGWTEILHKWSTGINNVYRLRTTSSVFYGTNEHKIVTSVGKIKSQEAEDIESIVGPFNPEITLDPQDIMDGLVIGDGVYCKANERPICLGIGENDQDYFDSEISHLIGRLYDNYSYVVKTTINHDELDYTYNRQIPERFMLSGPNKVCGLLRGIYSANGSIAGGRITLKSTSFKLIEQVQILLSSVGIASYYTTNKPTKVKFKNGTYLCKQSYDLNITRDADKFEMIIGFIQKYKQEKLAFILNEKQESLKPYKAFFDIKDRSLVKEEETFELTVSNNSKTLWCNGSNTSNCAEVGLYPQDSKGRSGWQFCNLSSINGAKIRTKKEWARAVEAATIIGTLQASLTNFEYLGAVSEEITRREALLGVSICGMMCNPELFFNPEIQKEMAELAKNVNKRVAAKLNINASARITLIKPDGHTGSLLGSSSGIHPHHSRRYIRFVQANELEPIAQHYKKINPKSVEKSVWSANNTDMNIKFACEIPEEAITKDQITAIEFLEKVKLTQINWVMNGQTEHSVDSRLHHNVSNTIHIKNHEWDEAEEFIFNNQDYLAGISMLPFMADKDFEQAPFTSVLSPEEILTKYGQASLFTSGLIEEALSLYNGRLWQACEDILNNHTKSKEKVNNDYEESLRKSRLIWIEKVNKFAKKYMNNNVLNTTYLLKDVYLYKIWTDLSKETKKVDYTECEERNNATQGTKEIACGGGVCEIL